MRPVSAGRQRGPPCPALPQREQVAELADNGTRRLQRLSVLRVLVLAMLGDGFVTVDALFSVLLGIGIGSPGRRAAG
jgi:hypothetical protein